MSDKISDLEARVGGALREIAQHASASSPGRGAIRDQLTADRGRSPGWLRPAAAAAAVVAVVGGLGAAIASQLNGTADPEEDPVANGFAEPGGTPPVTGKSDPAAGSIDAVNRTAARLTAHYDAPGYGKVEVDYDRATVTVLWSGQPPAGVTALEGPRPNGVTVILRQSHTAKHSWQQQPVKLLMRRTTRSTAPISPQPCPMLTDRAWSSRS